MPASTTPPSNLPHPYARQVIPIGQPTAPCHPDQAGVDAAVEWQRLLDAGLLGVPTEPDPAIAANRTAMESAFRRAGLCR